MVADGMGGAHAGEVASQHRRRLRARGLSRARAERGARGPARRGREGQPLGLRAGARARTSAAWAPPAPRCSCAAAQAWQAHVGDSRIYLVRAASCSSSPGITRWSPQLVAAQPPHAPSRPASDPRRNVVSRGASAPAPRWTSIAPRSTAARARATRCCSCTDGLHGVVDDREIADAGLRAGSRRRRCAALIDARARPRRLRTTSP